MFSLQYQLGQNPHGLFQADNFALIYLWIFHQNKCLGSKFGTSSGLLSLLVRLPLLVTLKISIVEVFIFSSKNLNPLIYEEEKETSLGWTGSKEGP